MGETNIVPFGKYKGKPVEMLVADGDYCEWLGAQPWFRERFGGIYQIIINGPQQPIETPEHNEMQAWFLDDDLCMRLAHRLRPEHDFSGKAIRVPVDLLDAMKRYPECFDRDTTPGRIIERSFENRGWDVSFSVSEAVFEVGWSELPCSCVCDHEMCRAESHCKGGSGSGPGWRCNHDSCIDEKGSRRGCCDKTCARRGVLRRDHWGTAMEMLGESGQWWRSGHALRVNVECKPSLGDDFPAVLRQVKSYDADERACRCVIVKDAAFGRVRWEDVVLMFATSGVDLLRMYDLNDETPGGQLELL